MTAALVYPVPAEMFELSSPFSDRRNPVTGEDEFHFGQDFAAADGTPILAMADGVVRVAGPADGFGEWIIIDHFDDQVNGPWSSVYGHMWCATDFVEPGQVVSVGERISSVGANGVGTGPHLHAEVWPGGRLEMDAAFMRGEYQPIDPIEWLRTSVAHEDWTPVLAEFKE